jgi:hypothetical protein
VYVVACMDGRTITAVDIGFSAWYVHLGPCMNRFSFSVFYTSATGL